MLYTLMVATFIHPYGLKNPQLRISSLRIALPTLFERDQGHAAAARIKGVTRVRGRWLIKAAGAGKKTSGVCRWRLINFYEILVYVCVWIWRRKRFRVHILSGALVAALIDGGGGRGWIVIR